MTCSATAPTWTQSSYGYYSPNSPPAIQYWVDAYDADSDLVALTTAGYDEQYEVWNYYGSTGNGAHRSSTGWGVSYYGEAAGKVSITDSTAQYNYDTTWEF